MAFLSIVFEGAPYILVGTIISGLIDAFLPSKLLERVLPRNKVLSTLIAGFLGLVFPVCECAIVPVIRRLLQKRLPLGCAMAYMLAAPIMNPVVAVSTMTAFKEYKGFAQTGLAGILQAPMMLGRLSLGYLIAVGVGLLVIRMRPEQILQDRVVAGITPADDGTSLDGTATAAPFDAKLVHAMRTAMRDFLDTGMYFVIGVAITSAFNTQVPQSFVNSFAGHDFIAIPALMVLAIVLSLCSTSDAFVAAPMTAFSGAAKLAFLVFGPMMDIKLLFMYSAVFKRRTVMMLLIGLFIVTGLLSWPWSELMMKLGK